MDCFHKPFFFLKVSKFKYMRYNKQTPKLACSNYIEEYRNWVVFVQSSLHLIRTVTLNLGAIFPGRVKK